MIAEKWSQVDNYIKLNIVFRTTSCMNEIYFFPNMKNKDSFTHSYRLTHSHIDMCRHLHKHTHILTHKYYIRVHTQLNNYEQGLNRHKRQHNSNSLTSLKCFLKHLNLFYRFNHQHNFFDSFISIPTTSSANRNDM